MFAGTRLTHVLAVLVAAALVFGVAACGDSDGDNDGGGGSPAAASGGDDPPESTTKGSDAEQIDALFARIEKSFAEVDGATYCDSTTRTGRRNIWKKSLAGGEGCAEVVEVFAARTRDAGVKQRPSKVVRVKVNGDTAIATVSNGGRSPAPVRVVREDGEWRMPSMGFTFIAATPEKAGDIPEDIRRKLLRGEQIGDRYPSPAR